MGVSSRGVNHIKIVKKKTVPIQSKKIDEVVSGWNQLLDFAPLTPYYNTLNVYNTDILKNKDGSYYTTDEAVDALKKYLGLETLPFNFPNSFSYDYMMRQLTSAIPVERASDRANVSFLRDVLRNNNFSLNYGLDKYTVGAALVNGKAPARQNPFRGKKEITQKMIDAGLLICSLGTKGNSKEYYLTPLGKTLGYLMLEFSKYTPANSPDFVQKVDDIFTEMNKNKNYDSNIYNTAIDIDDFYQYSSNQTYELTTPDDESILMIHHYQNGGYSNNKSNSFEDSLKSFDILVATNDEYKQMNKDISYNITKKVNESIKEGRFGLQPLCQLPLYKRQQTYQLAIMKNISLAKKTSNKITFEPMAMISSPEYKYDNGPNDVTVNNVMLFRSSNPNSPTPQYHKIPFIELKRFLLANDLKYSELEFSAFSNNPNDSEDLVLIITNKNNGKLVGLSNRIMSNHSINKHRYTNNYPKYEVYHTLNF